MNSGLNTHFRSLRGETFEVWYLHGAMYRKTGYGTWTLMSDADRRDSQFAGMTCNPCSGTDPAAVSPPPPPPKEPTDPFEHPIVDGKVIDGPEEA